MKELNWKKKTVIITIACAVVLVLALFVCVYGAAGKTYYVSGSGNDSWPGTKDKPFATVEHGIGLLKAGDTLYLRGGTYKETLSLGSSVKGSARREVTLGSAPGETAVISGSNEKKILLTVRGASYVNIEGLEFKDARGQDSSGINLGPGSKHIVIRDNTFHDITVPEPEEEDHCANCILIFGDSSKKDINHITIESNNFYNCKTGWAECISATGNVSHVNVRDNSIDNTGNIGIDFSGNYGYCKRADRDFPRHCTASGNRVKNCVSKYATSYGIYVDGGQDISIKGNEVSGCGGGIEIGAEEKPSDIKYSTENIRVKDNTVKANIENGITIGGYEKSLGWVRKVVISSNRCYDNGSTLDDAILTLNKCSGVSVNNNLFKNKKLRCAIVYSPFSHKHTRAVAFKGNRFYGGGPSGEAEFLWHGREYSSFKSWNKAMGGRTGTYGI